MIFDNDQIRNALLRANENLLFDIKEHGMKVVDTQDVDVFEELHAIEAAALLDALTNRDTKHQALRRYLWRTITDDAYENASEDLLDTINSYADKLREEK